MKLKRAEGYISGLRPTNEQGVNPKDGLGSRKVPLDTVPASMEVLASLAMGEGAQKYGPFNFRATKVQAGTYLAAARRHIKALLEGQDFDPKTGVPHICYALATLAIYGDAWINGYLIDNRVLPGMLPELMDKLARTSDEWYEPNDLQNIFLEHVAHAKLSKAVEEATRSSPGVTPEPFRGFEPRNGSGDDTGPSPSTEPPANIDDEA